MTAATGSFLELPGFAEAVYEHPMIQRLGQPADIANAAPFLASDDVIWITAEELRVDPFGSAAPSID